MWNFWSEVVDSCAFFIIDSCSTEWLAVKDHSLKVNLDGELPRVV